MRRSLIITCLSGIRGSSGTHGAEHDNGTKSFDVALHTMKEREVRVHEGACLIYQKKKTKLIIHKFLQNFSPQADKNAINNRHSHLARNPASGLQGPSFPLS